MKANLIVFSKNYKAYDSNKINTIIRQFTAVAHSFDIINVVDTCVSTSALLALFNSRTVIAVSFKETKSLMTIKTATDSFFNSTYQKQPFGFFATSNDKFCSIVDLDIADLEQALNYDSLFNLYYDCRNSFCLKLFDVTRDNLLNSLKLLPDSEKFDFSFHNSFGDTLLCVYPQSNISGLPNQLKTNLYKIYPNNIYFDGPTSLSQTLQDLLSVRNLKIGYINNSNITLIDSKIESLNSNLFTKISPKETKSILDKFNLDFIISINNTSRGYSISILDKDKEKNFEYLSSLDYAYDQEYASNLVLIKILQKVYKNIL